MSSPRSAASKIIDIPSFDSILGIYPEIADIKFGSVTCTDAQAFLMQPSSDVIRKDVNIRKGQLIDQKRMDEYIGLSTNPMFSSYDCRSDNIINSPLGFINPKNISQPANYHTIFKCNNEQYNRKLYWRGRKTHEIRSMIIDYFLSRPDSCFDVQYWVLPPKVSPYMDIKPDKTEYAKFIQGMQKSDMYLVLRGDRPWTHTFMDCLMTGTIPICIDVFYGDMGWEHLGYRQEDLLISFNTKYHTPLQIYESCMTLLNDMDRVQQMKHNIRSCYEKYVLSDRLLKKYGLISQCVNQYFEWRHYGWSDFFAAKMLEYYQNGCKLINNSFISPIVKNIKYI